jgi:hypothetical protein
MSAIFSQVVGTLRNGLLRHGKRARINTSPEFAAPTYLA